MVRSIYLSAALLIIIAGCGTIEPVEYEASTNTLIDFQHHIQPGFLQSHLEVIAHDSLMGRGTATEGLQKAAKYLSDFYDELNFTPMGDHGTYFQHFDLTTSKVDSLVTIQTENVVAYLEGSDPKLKDEVVVLMAHYDHMGVETSFDGEELIYNGADDNGSGTVALMAIADALYEAAIQGYSTRRSILFLHVSAEELGLLGSRYYSDHPAVPIDQTIAAFNADMIGRSDPENIATGDTDYVYLIGGEIISSGLDSLVVLANERSANMRLDRKYNDLTDRNQFYRRSDHWNLGRLGVPFVFFFTGVHEDYHQPTDTIDKIDFSKYNRVVQLIYTTTIHTANSSERPVMDNSTFIDITQSLPR